mmetsp:Transcript_50389/g.98766  ORF Transcript_50389/g.98766 Transcript_50389/m.98766 type:complete len:166 (+) Transcript_50389:66-563(+)
MEPSVLSVMLFLLSLTTAGCVKHSVYEKNLTYCLGLITYDLDSSLMANLTQLDDAALKAYQEDLQIWTKNRDVDCSAQVWKSTMCNNCLAIRRRWHCINAFKKCLPNNPQVGVCKGLCEDVNQRCKSSEVCEGKPDSDCSSAGSMFVLAASSAVLLVVNSFLQLV